MGPVKRRRILGFLHLTEPSVQEPDGACRLLALDHQEREHRLERHKTVPGTLKKPVVTRPAARVLMAPLDPHSVWLNGASDRVDEPRHERDIGVRNGDPRVERPGALPHHDGAFAVQVAGQSLKRGGIVRHLNGGGPARVQWDPPPREMSPGVRMPPERDRERISADPPE